jgi:DNA-binding response OmpR family regulator
MTSTPRPPYLLVVDDDVTTNRMLQGILTRAGFQTIGAFSVSEALKEIRESRPELVLLDVNLPDGSGVDVCRRLRSGPGAISIPVLFISSDDDAWTKVLGFEAGGVDDVTKPLAGAEIIARMSTPLRLNQASERLAEQAEQIR